MMHAMYGTKFVARGRGAPVGLALAFAATILLGSRAGADDVLVPLGSVWKYRDDGVNQGTTWTAPSPGFDDSGWASGAAELGYGDGDEVTVVDCSPGAPGACASGTNYITTYFRRDFPVADPSTYVSGILNLRRDDGAVVYLNGTEIFRSNLPAGPIGHLTPASSAISGTGETALVAATFPPSLLVAGTNTLAVEIHQSGASSSDISFDLELIGADGPSLARGPYLQRGADSAMVVRWRTNVPCDSRVLFGPAPGSLGSAVSDAALVTEHVVLLSGLAPATRFHYAVGTSASILAGDDADHFFTTSPTPGTTAPFRFWALGDSGTANANAAAVRDAFVAHHGSPTPDLVLMLGDNAYPFGTDAEYQAAVFDMYPETLRTTVLWPTLGNHDGASADSGTETGVYYDIFTLPRSGECGGLASGTEAYYSFDHANVHFVCLDSEDSDRSGGGAMLTWLASDLAATTRDWIVAFWHHPPYTKGSHDSDNASDSAGRMRDMRERALPILEAGGADLMLTGHSHSYERSYLLDGHYGDSSTLAPVMILDGGDGRPAGDGAYSKPAGLSSHQGGVYAVAGSSGQASGGSLDHPAMYISLNTLGSMVIDVDDARLDAIFLTSTGTVADSFTILKAAATPTASPSPTPTPGATASPSPTPGPTISPTVSPTVSPTAPATNAADWLIYS